MVRELQTGAVSTRAKRHSDFGTDEKSLYLCHLPQFLVSLSLERSVV